jgi:LysR family hydrogen peroxide-inducible transcriptional activator
VTLFERTKRSVSITPVGEEVVALSKQLMEQADAIVQLAKAHNNPLAGALRIGVIHTVSPYLMPLVLMPLKRAHPELRPVLTEEVTDNLMTMLHQHQLDAAIIATEEGGDEFETIPLFEEPFWPPSSQPRRGAMNSKPSRCSRSLSGWRIPASTRSTRMTPSAVRISAASISCC